MRPKEFQKCRDPRSGQSIFVLLPHHSEALSSASLLRNWQAL
jgi:hypothetical protein